MAEKVPKVSIGMPVYNGGAWISTAIESMLGQTFMDLELIIADNASLDNTMEICQGYASKDARVRYFRNAKNIGSSENYNVVFNCARGKYFKWAAANDYCDETMVEKCVAVLDARPDAVLCYVQTKLVDEENGLSESYNDDLDLQDEDACVRFNELLKKIRLNNAMNGLIRSDVLKKTPLMKKHISEDINLMAELTLYGKFVEVPEYLFYRRIGGESSTSIEFREELLRHYDPNNTNLMLYQEWKIYYDYCSAVLRSPLNKKQKLYLLKGIFRMGILVRHLLGKDAVYSTKKLLSYYFGFGSMVS